MELYRLTWISVCGASAMEGIGSNQQAGTSATPNIQAQVQTQIVESLSIYVSGLPLDIDEKDLGD